MSLAREIARGIGYVLLFGLLLFLPAWDAHNRRAWILLAVLLVARTGTAIYVHRRNPGLLEERRGLPAHADQPLLDRVLVFAFMFCFAVLILFTSWDAAGSRRYGAPPATLSALGLAAFAAGWLLIAHVLATNAFAVTEVRLQPGRQQTVTDRGAYRVVRHPMYAAQGLIMGGMALWLGSWAGVMASVVPMGFLVGRIVIEERLLRARLLGYAEYAGQVRYRLVPLVW